MQRAFEAMQERLYAAFDGPRFERRSDLIVLLCPELPIPHSTERGWSRTRESR